MEDTEAILQVSFIGTGGVTFINPRDDPRHKDGAQTRQGLDVFDLKRLARFCLSQPNQAMQRTAPRSIATQIVLTNPTYNERALSSAVADLPFR